jgi:hypothetical protein
MAEKMGSDRLDDSKSPVSRCSHGVQMPTGISGAGQREISQMIERDGRAPFLVIGKAR